jgi:SPP1 gp7 family putative phage head morphogenesis protein
VPKFPRLLRKDNTATLPAPMTTAISVTSAGGANVPDAVSQAMMAARMNSGSPFSPGTPISPMDGFGGEARAWNFPTGYNIISRPLRDQRVSFDTLKGLIDSYDVARMAIGHRIDDVRSLKPIIVPKRGVIAGTDDAVDQAYAALKKPDGKISFHSWLAKYLEDVLRYDAGVLQKRRDRAGRAIGLRVVSGATIAPVLDYYGETPTESIEWNGRIVPAPAYVQFVQGVPWKWFGANDLVYEPFRPQPDSPYGFAPLEAVLINANTDIRFQMHFLNYFTEGTVPFGFASAPEGLTSADQMREWQEYYDALMYGDDAAKHQMKWVAHGTTFDWPKDTTFNDQFALFLMRKTCAAFHVTPNDLGFTDDVNRATGDTQVDVQFRVGTAPLLMHLEEIISAYLQDDLGLPVEFEFDDGQEKEDRVAEAQAWQIYIDSGMASADEGRQQVLGLPIDEDRPVPRFINNARSGPIPLASLEAVAGKIDPETTAPAPDAQLPTTAFSPIPGVTPAKPPETPGLAEREFGPEAAQIPTVPGVTPGAQSTQKALTEGVTAESGITGFGLVEDDDDEPDVAKALRQWRDNARARVKAGKLPRRFEDVPDAVADPIWKHLATARTRDAVDAAFAKAGDASPKARWREPSTKLPSHTYDLALTDHYSPVVQAAIRAMFTDAQIRAAIEAAQGTVTKAIDPAVIDTRDAAKAALHPDLNDLKTAVQAIWGDSYLAGSHVAAQMAGGSVVGALDEVAASVDWSAWQPGYAAAANKVASGGLADLLSQADVTLRGIADATVDQIGNRIADGVAHGWSVDQIAASLSDILDDPSRADSIANTEANRAMSLASQDTYAANGVQSVTWLVSDPCPECAVNDGVTVPQGEDFPSGDSEPPAHPNCRCAIAPG